LTNETELNTHGARDPQLAALAASSQPAWLWQADGARILWANAAGVRVLGLGDAALSEKVFGPADQHRRQIAQLAAKLNPGGAMRMERLRGFGAAPGMLTTCACSRIEFLDGRHGMLVVGATAAPARVATGREGVAPPAAPSSFAEHAQPAQATQAPAEFALFDAFAEDHAAVPADAAAAGEPDRIEIESTPAQPAVEFETTQAGTLGKTALDAGPMTDDDNSHLLHFTWQTDREDHFALGPDEFLKLIGPFAAAIVGRPWREITKLLGLDPDGRMQQALDNRAPISGVALNWPVDGGYLPVELAGEPRLVDGQFDGYRGSGVCRDLAAIERLEMLRRHKFSVSAPMPQAASSDSLMLRAANDSAAPARQSPASETPPPTDPDTPVETPPPLPTQEPTEPTADAPGNVLPFRPPGDVRPPALTPVENSAFNELARQLSARLDNDNGTTATAPAAEAPATDESSAITITEPEVTAEPQPPTPDWLAPPEPPARGQGRRDKALLDLLPAGVLIYRLDRLLYANPVFLRRIGYDSLHALEEAGGLDALYVEPGVSTASSTSEAGTPVTISASHVSKNHREGMAAPEPTAARLHTISWDDDAALALICSEGAADNAPVAIATPAPAPEPEPAIEAPPAGHADAEDLGAILDTATEGILMFDAEGNVNACNRSAEALFGYDGADLANRNLAGLLAPESKPAVFEYLAGVRSAGPMSVLEHGREVLGRVRGGGIIQLSITIGRTRADGANFFAVFRDLSQSRRSENELTQARRLTERAANAKADMLARISHEIRTPLNAIIGFAEVMIGERFGALGNERYVEYMKDIRASGERVISLIDDLSDLSKIETGKIDLAFANQNLNEIVENCVAVMQPQANRERIIIRTSLAHTLPPVVADARALRQIALNLIGSSIHLAKAGGQVIVSTALSDFGEVVLRVRDTGQALNDSQVAAALEPFRADQIADVPGVSLSLTRALVEANRAQFHIKPGPHSGTLVEVVFSQAVARV
jgi:PAS domain S-box-containing protein